MRARLFVPILGLEPDHEVIHETPDSKVFPITVHTAPKREWAGLTEDEVIELLPVGAWDIESTLEFSQSIEAKLKEKNNV
jgi:hypothetical protein